MTRQTVTNEGRVDIKSEGAVTTGPLHRIAAVPHSEKKVGSSFD